MAKSKIMDQELVDRIVQAVEDGAIFEDAAAAGPIHKSTFWAWMNRGEEVKANLDKDEPTEYIEGSEPLLKKDFYDRIKRASSLSVNSAVRSIKRAWTGEHVKTETIVETTNPDGSVTKTTKRTYFAPDWHAGAWFCERRRPDQFGRHAVIKHKEEWPAKHEKMLKKALSEGSKKELTYDDIRKKEEELIKQAKELLKKALSKFSKKELTYDDIRKKEEKNAQSLKRWNFWFRIYCAFCIVFFVFCIVMEIASL